MPLWLANRRSIVCDGSYSSPLAVDRQSQCSPATRAVREEPSVLRLIPLGWSGYRWPSGSSSTRGRRTEVGPGPKLRCRRSLAATESDKHPARERVGHRVGVEAGADLAIRPNDRPAHWLRDVVRRCLAGSAADPGKTKDGGECRSHHVREGPRSGGFTRGDNPGGRKRKGQLSGHLQ